MMMMSVREAVTEYLESSSIRGLKYISKSKSTVTKCLWVIVVILVGLVFNPECKEQCNAYVVWLTTYKINREGVVASIGRMDRCKNGWHVAKARNVPDQLEIKVGGVTLVG